MELIDEVKLIVGSIQDSKRIFVESDQDAANIIARAFSANDIKTISEQCQVRNLFMCIQATTKPEKRHNSLLNKDFFDDVPMVNITISRKP